MRFTMPGASPAEGSDDDAGAVLGRHRRVLRLIPPPDLMAVGALVFLLATGWSLMGNTDSDEDSSAGFVLHSSPVEALDVAPDGRTVASASRDGTARVWTLNFEGEGRIIAECRAGFSSIAVSPDGRAFTAGGFDGTALVGDLATGKVLATLGKHEGAVRGVAFAVDGGALASGGDDGLIRVWDVRRQRERCVLRGHDGAVTGLAFAPSGRALASVGLDGQVAIWDLGAGELRTRVDADLGPLRTVAIAPDGCSLAVAGAHGVAVCDLASGRVQSRQAGRGIVTKVRYLNNGASLASTDWDGALTLWHIEVGVLSLGSRHMGHRAKINALAVGPGGNVLVTGDQLGTIRSWDVSAIH